MRDSNFTFLYGNCTLFFLNRKIVLHFARDSNFIVRKKEGIFLDTFLCREKWSRDTEWVHFFSLVDPVTQLPKATTPQATFLSAWKSYNLTLRSPPKRKERDKQTLRDSDYCPSENIPNMCAELTKNLLVLFLPSSHLF